jgi:hypothetical protein
MLKQVLSTFLRTTEGVEMVPTVTKGYSYTQSSRSRNASGYSVASMRNCWTSWNLRVSGVETLTIRKNCYIGSRVRVRCNAISTQTLASRPVVLSHSLVVLEQRISITYRLCQLLSPVWTDPTPNSHVLVLELTYCTAPSLSMLNNENCRRHSSLVARSIETMLT